MPTFTGTNADDTLIGTDDADIISGLGGNDTIYGRGGNDVIDPGAGTDVVYAGDGDDTVIVSGRGPTNAEYFGEGGRDTLDLSLLTAADPALFTSGSDGSLSLNIGFFGSMQHVRRIDGFERFVLTPGADRMLLTGHTTSVEINGGAGVDILQGGSGADVIRGGLDSDTIIVGEGDEAYGEDGFDQFSFTASPVTRATIDGGVGRDSVTLAGYTQGSLINLRTGLVEGTDIRLLNIEGLTLTYTSAQTQPLTIICNDEGNFIRLSTQRASRPLTIEGGAGADNLAGFDVRGGAGNDLLTGVLMSGGEGDDALMLIEPSTTADSTRTVDGGAGIDTLSYTGSRALNLDLAAGTLTMSGFTGVTTTVQGIENVVSGGANDVLRGDGQANVIQGGGGNDRIEGGAGNDILYGSTSNPDDFNSGLDTLLGEEGNDQLYGGAGADTLDGGVGDDLLDGGSENDILNGGDGNDRLLGGTGDDTLNGGAGDDFLNGGVGTNTLDGGDGRDEAVFDIAYAAAQISYDNGVLVISSQGAKTTVRNVESVRFTDYVAAVGSDGRLVAPNEIFGSNDADRITGTAGGDRIIAGNGDDFLIGGASGDILDGGAGIDTAGYSGLVRAYGVGRGSGSFSTVSGGPEGGTDSLVSIERLSFLDGTLDLNPNGAAAQIYRLYDAALDRAPDQAGLSGWVGRLGAGTTLAQAAQAFATAPEFVARYGNLSNEDFVKTMYRFSLNREGDTSGVAAWKAQLDSGVSRGDVLLAFSESVEHSNVTAAAVNAGLFVQDERTIQVARLYDAAFDRVPDQGGIAYWRGTLETGGSLFAIANAFVSSQEFQDRYGALNNTQFIDQLYRFTLNREADAFGRQVWVDRLNSGTTRAEMVVIFSESVEHVNLTAPTWAGGIRYENYVEPTSAAAETISSKDMDAFVMPADPDGGGSGVASQAAHFQADLDSLPHATLEERLIVAHEENLPDFIPVPDLAPVDALTAGHNHSDWI